MLRRQGVIRGEMRQSLYRGDTRGHAFVVDKALCPIGKDLPCTRKPQSRFVAESEGDGEHGIV